MYALLPQAVGQCVVYTLLPQAVLFAWCLWSSVCVVYPYALSDSVSFTHTAGQAVLFAWCSVGRRMSSFMYVSLTSSLRDQQPHTHMHCYTCIRYHYPRLQCKAEEGDMTLARDTVLRFVHSDNPVRQMREAAVGGGSDAELQGYVLTCLQRDCACLSP